MSKINENTTKLKLNLKRVIKNLSRQYSSLVRLCESKNESDIAKIHLTSDEIFHLLDDCFDIAIENFSYSPLGKDLRRNISYIMTIKSLGNISSYTLNIVKYLKENSEYKISNKWVVELSGKIIRRLKLLDNLMTTENKEKAFFLFQEDESVSELYRKELKSLNNKIENSKVKLTSKQKENATSTFILAIKSFDYVGDSIKEIARISLFISTGKLK